MAAAWGLAQREKEGVRLPWKAPSGSRDVHRGAEPWPQWGRREAGGAEGLETPARSVICWVWAAAGRRP